VSDPYFDDVTLLLPCNGVDGSTTFVDFSTVAHAVTAAAQAQVDAAQSQWGGASCLLDGTNDALIAGVAGDFDCLHDGTDFTAELWVRFDTTSASQCLFDTGGAQTATRGALLWSNASSNLQMLVANGVPGGYALSIIGSTVVAADEWHHIAVVCNSNTVTVYLNGAVEASGSLSSPSASSSSYALNIGRRAFDGGQGFSGWVDDVRITDGVARYTSSFTRPAAAFPVAGEADAIIALPGPLAPPLVLTSIYEDIDAIVAIPSPLPAPPPLLSQSADFGVRVLLPGPLAPRPVLQNDYSTLQGQDLVRYVLRITGDPVVELPISSWQATLQTDRQDYLQCVVPGVTEYADVLAARQGVADMVVYRVLTLADGSTADTVIAQAPLTTINMTRGAYRHTATLSGYRENVDTTPPAETRTLQGVRQQYTSLSGNSRLRADIDWLLRPGQTATDGDITLTANYINIFVPAVGDAYMDVGSRG
jgi:hypothetical protein